MNNDKDYLFHNCEDNLRFDKMTNETKEERIEQYEAKFEENLRNPKLISESFAECSNNMLLILALKNPPGIAQSIIYDHIYRVTTVQIGFDKHGVDHES